MASQICEERSDIPSPKRQKMKPKTYYDYDECTPEEIQQYDDEWEKSQGFEIDFSKLTYWSVLQPVDLDDSTWGCDSGFYETDRDFIAFMAQAALTKFNAEKGTSLKLGKILMANWYSSGCAIFNISFEVNDPSESYGNQTKPFRAVVGYLGRDRLDIYHCDPKPSP